MRRAQAAAAIGEAGASKDAAGFESARARTSLASNAKPFHTLLLLGLLERVPGCSPVGSVRPPTQGLGGGARCRAAASMAGGISGAGPAPTTQSEIWRRGSWKKRGGGVQAVGSTR